MHLQVSFARNGENSVNLVNIMGGHSGGGGANFAFRLYEKTGFRYAIDIEQYCLTIARLTHMVSFNPKT